MDSTSFPFEPSLCHLFRYIISLRCWIISFGLQSRKLWWSNWYSYFCGGKLWAWNFNFRGADGRFSESLILCWEFLIWEILRELPSRSSFPWYWRYSFAILMTWEESQRQYSKRKDRQQKVKCQSVRETFSIRESPAMQKKRKDLTIPRGCSPKQDRVDSCITQLIK